MRDIEFRGIDEHTNKFVYGKLLNWNGAIIYEEPTGATTYNLSESVAMSTYYVKEDTIGQYTGLKDKNGTKIFEGDIVHCVAQFDNGDLFVVFEDGEFRLVPIEKKDTYVTGMGFHAIRCFTKEVIGNIYENGDSNANR